MISKNLQAGVADPFAHIFDPKADSGLPDEEIKHKKQRYLSFDAAREVPRIARSVFDQPVVSWRILPETSNAIDHIVFEIRIVIDQVERSFICRLNTSSETEHYLLAENLLYRRWREMGIALPEVMATRLRDSVFPYDFTVAERVGTGNLEVYLAHHREEEAFYAEAAGTYLARLHQLPLPGFGYFSQAARQKGHLVGVHASWSEAILTQVPETVYFLIQNKLMPAGVAKQAGDVLTRHRRDFDIAAGAALHGDYHHANIIIDERSRKIVAAVDLSQAKVGDPLFDIAFYATYYSDDAVAHFVRGYESQRKLPAHWEARVALYQVRILLSKIKLRYRFGYAEAIPRAVAGIEAALQKI